MEHYEEVLKILHDKFDWKLTDSLTTTGKKLVADTIKALKIAENNQNLQLQQTGVMPRFISLVTSFDFNSINEKIDWLGIQREDIISLQHTKNDGFCLYYFKNEA